MRNKFLLTLLLWLTLLGSTWAQNNALHFDGTDDHVSSTNFTATSFTVEAWVKPDRVNTDQAIISTLSTTTNTGFELHIKEDATPVFTLRDNFNWRDISAYGTISVGQWVHLAISFDNAIKKATVYMNGIYRGDLYLSVVGAYRPGDAAMYMGRRSSGDLYFNGSIDEVRVWSTVRTHAEIIESMTATLVGNEPGLNRYYAFNQGTAGTDNSAITSLTDLTSNAIHGSLTNFGLSDATSNWVEGFNTNDLSYEMSVLIAAVSIERTSGSTANFSISSNTSWTITSNADWLDLSVTSSRGNAFITVTANETNTLDTLRTAQLVVSSDNVENDTVSVIQQRGQIQVSSSSVTITGSSGSTATVNITSNTDWSIEESAEWLSVSPVSGSGNATLTITSESVNAEEAARTTELIISGANAESKTVTVTQSVASLALSRTSMEIDAAENSRANFFITTDVDWNASSSASWLSMNATSGTGNARITVTAEALPEGVTQRHGTILVSGDFNPAVIAVKQFALPNNALDFDGGDDFVMLPTFGADVNFSQGFTYTAWIQWKAFNNWSKLLDFGNGAGNYNITFGNEGTSNALYLAVFNGGNQTWLITEPILPTQKWVHVAASVSNTGAAKIYINGLVVASGNLHIPTAGPLQLCYFGKSNWTYHGFFKGTMDEVSIWNKELSEAEVWTARNEGFVGTESNLVAYYPFNQGVAGANNTSITHIFDNTSNMRDGAMSMFAQNGNTSNWVEGSTRKALSATATTNLGCDAGTTELEISSTVDWTASSSADWLTLSAENGTENAILTVSYAENINSYDDRTATVTLAGTDVDTVRITFTQARGIVFNTQFSALGTFFISLPATVAFTDNSTVPNATITSWEWNFGDGTTSIEQNPVHAYQDFGVYSVSLVVSDGTQSDTLVKENYIRVSRDINMFTGTAIISGTANFYDTGGPNNDYTNNENDTLVFYASTPGAVLQFDLKSFYTEHNYDILRLYNGDNLSSPLLAYYEGMQIPTTITASNTSKALCAVFRSDPSATFPGWYAVITEIPPVTDFTTPDSVIVANSSVQFTDASVLGGVNSWSWDFGDGNTSTEQNPTHTYTSVGTYTVTLTISNGLTTKAVSKILTIIEDIYARFSADITSGYMPTVQFTNASILATNYEWNFGDGSEISTDENPSHTFNTTGTYTVTLTAFDGDGNSNQTSVEIVAEEITPAFSADVTSGYQPTVQFTDETVGATSWSWNFGDGSELSTEQNPSHFYTTAGSYAVSLTVSDGFNTNTLTRENYIVAANIEANFSADNTLGFQPTIQFTDATIGATSWAWDFGDGSTSTEQNPLHTYTSMGTFDVSLAVFDGYNRDTLVRQGYVTSVSLICDFQVDTAEGYLQTVNFTDISGGNITSWHWDFGDGTTSTEQNPVHTYETMGVFTVSLTISDGNSTVTEVKENYIVTDILRMQAATITLPEETVRFYDTGGSVFDYNNSENYTLVLYPSNPGMAVSINFTALYFETPWDKLHIFDGTSTNATQVTPTNGLVTPQTITATNPNGALSIRFTSDGSVVGAGWEATISQVTLPMVIQWRESATLNYGMPLTGTLLDATTNMPGTVSYSYPEGTVLDAGIQTVTATFTPEDTNFPVTTKTLRLIVNKVNIVAKANDLTMPVGGEIPELTFTYSGFVNNDDVADIDLAPVATTKAKSTSSAGDYTIFVLGGLDNNYNIEYQNGTLTLTTLDIPVITWDNPSDIPYGTELSDIQLNATANVEGTVEYNPAAGTRMNVGNSQALTVTFTPTDGSTYAVVRKTVSINVNRANLVATAQNQAKIYGDANPQLLISYEGFVGTDYPGMLQIVPSALTSATINSSAGTYEIGITVGYHPNYNISYVPGILTINPRALTLSSFTAESKTYDGTTSAPGAGFSDNRIDGDELTFSFDAAFEDKTASYEKTVNFSNIAISGGTHADNYVLSTLEGTAIAHIYSKMLTLEGSFTVQDKTYDATTNATMAENNLTLEGVIEGDIVTFEPQPEFATSLVGNNILVSLDAGSDFEKTGNPSASTKEGADNSAPKGQLRSLTGDDSNNYHIMFNESPTTTANITPATLTITGLQVESKVYDGTTQANLSGGELTGVFGSDVIYLGMPFIGNFAQSNVGTDIPVSVAQQIISGPDVDNYVLEQPSYMVADITPRNLVLSTFMADSKVYDGTTDAFGTMFNDDRLEGDELQISYTAAFENKNANTFKSVFFSNFGIESGADKDNYTIVTTTGSAMANITPKEVTVTGLMAIEKIYDGTNTATLNGGTLQGVISSDDVSAFVPTTGTFAQTTIGTDLAVSFDEITLHGDDQNNYTVTQPLVTGTITAKPLTITANDITKTSGLTYTFAGIEFTTSEIVNGDAVTSVSLESAGAAADALLGGFTIFVSNAQGIGLTNYSIEYQEGMMNVVEQTELLLTGIVIEPKVYDGTVTATVENWGTLGEIAEGDNVTLDVSSAVATFDNKNAGEGKVVTITGLSLSDSDANKYYINNHTVTGVITPRSLALNNFIAANKTYDGTTTVADFDFQDNHLEGDQIMLSMDVAFENKHAGVNKTVLFSNIAIASGADINNYTLASTTGTATATITPKELTVTGLTALDKVYDGTNSATISGGILEGVIISDDVTANIPTVGTFEQETIGTNLAVTFAEILLSGIDKDNYALTQPSGLTANITAKPLTITANSRTKTVGLAYTFAGTEFTTSEMANGDAVTSVSLESAGASADALVGEYPILVSNAQGSGLENYSIDYAQGTMYVVDQIELFLTDIVIEPKVYDGTVAATVENWGTLHGIVQGDIFILDVSGATATLNNKNVGENKSAIITGLALTGQDAHKYFINNQTASGYVTPKELTIGGSFTVQNKEYDGTTETTIDQNNLELVTVVDGDDVQLNPLAAFATSEVGEEILVSLTDATTLTGSDQANYSLSLEGAPTTTANITEIVIPQYTLTINVVGEGSVNVNGTVYSEVLTFDENTVVNLEALAASGYEFANWTGAVAEALEATTTVTMTENRAITATFTEILVPQYTLTISVVGEGSVNVNGTVYIEVLTFDENTVVNLEALAANGYEFAIWTGPVAEALEANTTVTMTENTTVTATFTEIVIPQYTLTISVVGQGSVNVNGTVYSEVLTFDENTVVNLEALAADGYVFDSWTGPVANALEATTTITLTENRTITATFTEIVPEEYTVTFSITDDNGQPLQGATILFDGIDLDLETNENGVATVELENGDYAFTVSKEGYISETESFTVNNDDVEINLQLSLVGISNVTLTTVKLYPNPVVDVVNLERNTTERVTVEVYSNNGALLYTTVWKTDNLQLNVADYKNGLFHIRIVGQEIENLRFIKQ